MKYWFPNTGVQSKSNIPWPRMCQHIVTVGGRVDWLSSHIQFTFMPKSPCTRIHWALEIWRWRRCSLCSQKHSKCACVSQGAPLLLHFQSTLHIVLSFPISKKACHVMKGFRSHLCGHGQVTLPHWASVASSVQWEWSLPQRNVKKIT